MNDHAAHQDAFDTAFIACHQRLLDQRDRARDAGRGLRIGHDLPPVGQLAAIALDNRMSVEANDLVEQLGTKPVHNAHHDDQRRHAQHNGKKADARHQEDKAFAAPGEQIASGDHALMGGKDHAAPLKRAGRAGKPARLWRNQHSACQIDSGAPFWQ